MAGLEVLYTRIYKIGYVKVHGTWCWKQEGRAKEGPIRKWAILTRRRSWPDSNHSHPCIVSRLRRTNCYITCGRCSRCRRCKGCDRAGMVASACLFVLASAFSSRRLPVVSCVVGVPQDVNNLANHSLHVRTTIHCAAQEDDIPPSPAFLSLTPPPPRSPPAPSSLSPPPVVAVVPLLPLSPLLPPFPPPPSLPPLSPPSPPPLTRPPPRTRRLR